MAKGFELAAAARISFKESEYCASVGVSPPPPPIASILAGFGLGQ